MAPPTPRKTPLPVSPDCRTGNHQKCYGDAWDEEHDRLSICCCEAPECVNLVSHGGTK